MALQLPSDLIADVARAAQPDRLRAATLRLRENAEGASLAFAAELRDAASHSSSTNLSGLRERLGSGTPVGAGASPAGKGLETLLLKTMVDGVLPKKTQIFGRGVAGESWRMVLSDALAQKLAASNRLGMAQSLGGALAQPTRVGV